MKIKNVSEFVERISKISNSFIKNGVDKNEVPLFRGQADVDYELIPSIARQRNSEFSITIFNEERNLIDACKLKMPDIFTNNLSPIELLAILQHHGIPTRLLDVTQNALVALYFACCSEPDKDGEVFVFKHNEISITNYPLVEAIADSYRFGKDTFCSIKDFYERVYGQPYFLEQRSTLDVINNISSKDLYNLFQVNNLGEYIAKLCEDPLFVYAPIRDMRQQIQCGGYILFPNAIEDLSTKENATEKVFTAKINPIPKDHKCIIEKIQVPAKVKGQIINELRRFGISEETLFCDNIDIVCKSIRQSYEDKVKSAPL